MKTQTAVKWFANKMMTEYHSKKEWDDIIEKALEMEKEQIISFAEWYSGMEKEKVERAYKRYLNETFKS